MRNKRPVVIVVPALPRPETNAGDWRVYSLACHLARRIPITVAPLCASGDDADRRSLLERQGITVAGIIRHPRQLQEVITRGGVETVIFEKYFGVDLHPFIQIFPSIKRILIDVHELEYLRVLRKARLAARPARARSGLLRLREISLLKWADALIAISEEEERRLRTIFPLKNIIRIPTCVPVESVPRRPFSQRCGLCFPAFFGHGPNHDAAEYFTRRILPSIREKMDISFDLIGAGSETFDRTKVPGSHARGFVEDMTTALSAYRVMVYPLRYGAGACKKILDAAVAGTPVITTRIGAEGLRLRNGSEISIADDPKAFAKAVCFLYQNETKWKKISVRAYTRVRELYSLESMEKAVEGLYSLIV